MGHSHLGRKSEIKNRVRIYYLPWLQQIQSPSNPNSLYNAVVNASKAYEDYLADSKKMTPPEVRKHFSDDIFSKIIDLEVGQDFSANAGCGYYERCRSRGMAP